MSPWVTVLPNQTEMSLFLEVKGQRATFKPAASHGMRQLLWKSYSRALSRTKGHCVSSLLYFTPRLHCTAPNENGG